MWQLIELQNKVKVYPQKKTGTRNKSTQVLSLLKLRFILLTVSQLTMACEHCRVLLNTVESFL